MDKIDLNKDGLLNFEEFLVWYDVSYQYSRDISQPISTVIFFFNSYLKN